MRIQSDMLGQTGSAGCPKKRRGDKIQACGVFIVLSSQ